uniref:Large ribosomal subunit protein bL32c n=1 Tax=Chondria sp. (in: red algae) TaxID=1982705 RepID=A0A1Z1MQ39_9FLOR|nr:ribosomal protein L32 [Chondria sp. (in: red algae)]
MAVPKKRTSKSKSRKPYWHKQADIISKRSLSLAKSLLTGKSTNFVYTKPVDILSNL